MSNNISEPVVIPLGVNAQSGIDYTIKLKERPQQEGVFIYLKDKLDNSMTFLTDEDYSFNTSTDHKETEDLKFICLLLLLALLI